MIENRTVETLINNIQFEFNVCMFVNFVSVEE